MTKSKARFSNFTGFFQQVSIRSSGCDEKESKPKVDGDGGGFALSRAWMFDGYYWVELQDMHEVSKGPSLYYVSIFLAFMDPIHPHN